MAGGFHGAGALAGSGVAVAAHEQEGAQEVARAFLLEELAHFGQLQRLARAAGDHERLAIASRHRWRLLRALYPAEK